MNSQTLLLQAPPSATPQLLIFVAIIIVMYFFMLRPQSKKIKAQKDFEASIAVGEQIITTAGIHGKVNKVNDDGTLQLEIARSVFIVVERSAISSEMTLAYRKKNEVAPVAASTK